MFSFLTFKDVAIAIVVVLVVWNFKRISVITRCLPRELKFLAAIARMIYSQKKDENKTLGELFHRRVREHPNKPAVINAETGASLTFLDFECLSNRISNYFQGLGYTKGDNVVVLLHNCVEYIPIYIGLSNIGVSTTFLNTNHRGESLKHSLNVLKFKAIIFHDDLEHLIHEIDFFHDNAAKTIDYYMLEMPTRGDNNKGNLISENSSTRKASNLHDVLESISECPPKIVGYEINADLPVAHIFTSGTTGHPKPAIMARKKFMTGFLVFRYLTEISTEDVVYNTLPMFHTSGSLIFFAGTIIRGCTMIIRKKFSASKFLDDCRKYEVTYAGYIGETMRYLLAQTPKDNDHHHKVKKIVGNGLRRSLFPKIKERFNFPLIYEFYGATEANFGFINNDNTLGAVGFLFKCFPFLNLKKLVKVDRTTGELIRGDDGLAVECGPNEEGTMIALINNNQPYYGYVNKKDSNKKVARDVFKTGDSYFMTGDILTTDQYGYLYFVDRLGDTFRWKGENVSTVEVENVVTSSFGDEDVHCIVYGVEVDGHEGKAGMLYIQSVTNGSAAIDEQWLTKALMEWQQNLPPYALPKYVRVGSKSLLTETYKYKKESLKREGYGTNHLEADERLFTLVKQTDGRFKYVTLS